MRVYRSCFVKPCKFSITRIGYSLALSASATAMYYSFAWENISHGRARGASRGALPTTFFASVWILVALRLVHLRRIGLCAFLAITAVSPQLVMIFGGPVMFPTYCSAPLEVYFCWEDRHVFSSWHHWARVSVSAGICGDQSIKSSSLTHCRCHTNSSCFCRSVLLLSKQHEYSSSDPYHVDRIRNLHWLYR